MKAKYEHLEEVNMMFEMIKTMLLTWLAETKVKKLLKNYTHFEIRSGKLREGKFVITDLIMHDGTFCKKHLKCKL